MSGVVPGSLAGAAIQGTVAGGITNAINGDFWSGFQGGAIAGAMQGGILGYQNALANDRGILFGNQLGLDGVLARQMRGYRNPMDWYASGGGKGQASGGIDGTDQSLQGFEFTDQEVQDNLKFHSKGMLAKGGWTTKALGPVKFEAGQIVEMKMTNTNVLPVTFTVKWANPAFQDLSTHYLLLGQSATVNGAIFTAEPTLWNFSVTTPSDVLMLQYVIRSTWIPGDPPNR